MSQVRVAAQADFQGWISLAREIEPLFGPMADEPGFRDGLRQAITAHTAFCVADPAPGSTGILGGVVISLALNEIAWLAVTSDSRGKRIGAALVERAICELDSSRPIYVTTFAADIAEGQAARKLYREFGFSELGPGRTNPAGMATVVMHRQPAPSTAS